MSDVRVTARTGEETLIVGAEIDDFRSSLVGRLMQIEDPGYNEARSLWNAMIDRRPSLIARCAGTADVIHSVNFAREHNLLVTVRGAGHNIAGMAASDGSLMIDLSAMKWARVDAVARTALAGPGATLRHLDHETQAFGLATPLGVNST